MLALPFLLFAAALLFAYKGKKQQAMIIFLVNLTIIFLIWRVGYTNPSFVWNLQF